MATELVRMDKTALNDALYQTADAIRTVYGNLATQTQKQAYATAATVQYEFENTGFQDAIYDLADAIVTEAASAGGSGSSGVTVKSGSVTLSSARQIIEVTPESGKTPIFAVVENADPRYGSNGTMAVAYSKLPIAMTISSRYQNGYFGAAAQTANNNTSSATCGVPNASATWIDAGTGKITFTGASGYQFLPGTYNWYAIYGEVYS